MIMSDSPGPPSPRICALREVIRTTKLQLYEIEDKYSEEHRPSLIIDEVNDLNARLAELENKEKALLAQVQSETAEVDTDSSDREPANSSSSDYSSPSQLSPTVTSPGSNRFSVHLPLGSSQPNHPPLTSSMSLIPVPSQSSSSTQFQSRTHQGLIKVFLPEGQRTTVHVKANQTIKQALKKAMTTRDLTTTQCVPFVIQADKPKFMVDWNTSTALLGGQEVYVEYRVGNTLGPTNHHNFVRKTFITWQYCNVCKKHLFQGFKCEICGYRYHQRCSPKVPIFCSYLDEDILYARILSGQNPPSAVLTPPSVTPTPPLSTISSKSAYPNIPGHMEPLRSDSPPDQYQPAHRRVSRERSISTPSIFNSSTASSASNSRDHKGDDPRFTRSTSPHIRTMGAVTPTSSILEPNSSGMSILSTPSLVICGATICCAIPPRPLSRWTRMPHPHRWTTGSVLFPVGAGVDPENIKEWLVAVAWTTSRHMALTVMSVTIIAVPWTIVSTLDQREKTLET